MTKHHAWKPKPTTAHLDRLQCARPDCGLLKYPLPPHRTKTGKTIWRQYFMRGRRVVRVDPLGSKTPPCGPPTKDELKWS